MIIPACRDHAELAPKYLHGSTPAATSFFTTSCTASIVTVSVEARNIPPGTAIVLDFPQDNGSERVVTTTPLVGTFELSRATASVTFPGGVSHLNVKASWRQPPMK